MAVRAKNLQARGGGPAEFTERKVERESTRPFEQPAVSESIVINVVEFKDGEVVDAATGAPTAVRLKGLRSNRHPGLLAVLATLGVESLRVAVYLASLVGRTKGAHFFLRGAFLERHLMMLAGWNEASGHMAVGAQQLQRRVYGESQPPESAIENGSCNAVANLFPMSCPASVDMVEFEEGQRGLAATLARAAVMGEHLIPDSAVGQPGGLVALSLVAVVASAVGRPDTLPVLGVIAMLCAVCLIATAPSGSSLLKVLAGHVLPIRHALRTLPQRGRT
jgi:hypothetical protein